MDSSTMARARRFRSFGRGVLERLGMVRLSHVPLDSFSLFTLLPGQEYAHWDYEAKQAETSDKRSRDNNHGIVFPIPYGH